MVTKFAKIACSALLAFSTSTSFAAYWSPHIGIDYKYWGAKAGADQSQFGIFDFPQLFPTINSAANFYVGTRINGIWGIDIGYEQSEKKEKTAHFDGQLQLFGPPGTSGDFAVATNRLKAGHLDALFYWEIYDAFELLFMAGIAYLHADTDINYFSNTTNLFTLEKVKSKWVGRGGFGAQYNPVPCIGLRALVHFDGTQRIEYIGNNVDGAPYDINPYKSATSFYVGAVYSFSRPRR